MVNRGGGDGRRPAPPSGRPGGRPPARPVEDSGEEKTSAINLADINLDDVDEIPASAVARPSPGAARGAPPARRAINDDDGNEKTSAINLGDINLDDEPPAKAPPARPGAGPAKKADAPSQADIERAMRDSAGPSRGAPAKRAPVVDDGNEKTSALNLADLGLDDEPPAKAPPPKAAPPVQRAVQTLSKPAQAPKVAPPVAKAEPPPAKKAESLVEKTQAVSLEEFEKQRSALARGKAAPSSADATFLGDDEDDIPVVKAPPPKKIISKDDASKAAAAASAAAASGADGDPKMIVRVGADIGKVYQLAKDLTLVGRGLDADFVINDASASRKHFNIVRTLSGWKMVDLGSGNGTKVNGNRVTEIALVHGMRIEAGGTTLEWVVEEAAPAKAAAAVPAAKVRETAKEEPKPGRHPGTLAPGLGGGGDDDIAAGVKRRVPESNDGGKRRDASRMKLDDEPKKGGGGAAEDEGDGSEKTSYSDVAALELDPNWEARRAKMRREAGGGGGDEMVAVSGGDDFGPDAVKGGKGKNKGKAAKQLEPASAEPEEVEVSSGGGAGKKIAIALGVVALLGGGFVAADKFAGLGIIFPVASKTSQVAVADPETKKPEEPTKEPEEPTKKPEDPTVKPEDPTAKPADPTAKPEDPTAKPEDPTTKPADPTAKPEDPTAKPPDNPSADPKKDAVAKLAEGNTALDAKQPLLAKMKFNEAVKLDPTNDDVSTGLAKVNVALKNWTGFVSGLKLSGEKKWDDAAKAIESIPDDAPNAAAVIPFRTWVVNQQALELTQKAVAAYNAKDFATAKTAIGERLKIEELGDDKQWAELFLTAVDKAASPEGKLTEVMDPADPKGKTEAKPLDFKPFFALYVKPDFEGALNFLASAQPLNGGELAVSKADAARAASMEGALFFIQGLLTQASQDAKGDKAEEALAQLYKLRRADALLDSSQGPKITQAMAEALVSLSKKASEAKQDANAQILAHQAAVLDPNNTTAKPLDEQAQTAAKQKVADAKPLLATEPDKAAAMLVEAVQVLPSTAPEYADAWKLLEPYLKAD